MKTKTTERQAAHEPTLQRSVPTVAASKASVQYKRTCTASDFPQLTHASSHRHTRPLQLTHAVGRTAQTALAAAAQQSAPTPPYNSITSQQQHVSSCRQQAPASCCCCAARSAAIAHTQTMTPSPAAKHPQPKLDPMPQAAEFQARNYRIQAQAIACRSALWHEHPNLQLC